MKIIDSVYTSLRAIGKDQHWVRDWIVDKPSRLGLGDIDIKRHKCMRYGGVEGHLDIMAYRADIDTFYDIKIMLDACDATYGIKMLNYWSRERRNHSDSTYVAVLVSEDMSCRYQSLLEGLPQVLPFIGIELKVLSLPFEPGVATILTSIIVQSQGLNMGHGRKPNRIVNNVHIFNPKHVERPKPLVHAMTL